MTAASASHRLLNFVQSALLLGLMAAIAWIAVTAIVGPETGLHMALTMVGGLLFAPALPRRLLLSAYQAQRLTGRDAPGLVAALAELARRAGLQRAGALSRAEPAAERLRPGQARGQRHLRHSPAARPARRRELAGVLAHEIGHIANRELWIMSLADMMSRLVSLTSWLGQLLLLLNLPLVLAGFVHGDLACRDSPSRPPSWRWSNSAFRARASKTPTAPQQI